MTEEKIVYDIKENDIIYVLYVISYPSPVVYNGITTNAFQSTQKVCLSKEECLEFLQTVNFGVTGVNITIAAQRVDYNTYCTYAKNKE